MRRLAILLLLAGAALTAWVIVHSGTAAIGGVLGTVGIPGLAAIAAFHLIGTTLMGLAWWRLRQVGKRRTFVWARLVRDAGSEVLPLSQIGGYVLGARSVIIQGFSGVGIAASTVIDATLEFLSQIAFVALSLVLFVSLSPDRAIARWGLTVLGISVAAAAVLVAVQRRRSSLLTRIAERMADSRFGRIVDGAAAVHAEIRAIARFDRVWRSYLLHFAAWLAGGVEAWLALRFMGVHLALAAVLAIEGLVVAMRAMAFAVPGALGVQEGAYLVIGGALGLAPEVAVGLSLLKRGRDFALGIPALAMWQISESRRRWRGDKPVPVAVPLDPSRGE